MQQQQEHKERSRMGDKDRARTHVHNLTLDDNTYYAIKQLSSIRGYKFPITLISEIFKDYIEAHKTELRQ